jgi:3-oxoadipate enol-lactonase
MPTARVNGITMYYEQHGAGEPLLLINGLGAGITLLAPHRVVAFDNRGAGRAAISGGSRHRRRGLEP